MLRFPLRKHYVVTPGAGASSGSSPGGGANAIQTNNGAGGFSGVGELTASQITLPAGNGSGGSGIKLSNGANDYGAEYLANPTSGYSGGSVTTNILDTANLQNNTVLWIEAFVQLVKTSGTPGNEGLAFRVKAAFRKDNTGTIVQIGASVYDAGETFNDTGDSLVGSPSLAVSAGSIALTFNLTTVETFRVARWVKFRATAGSGLPAINGETAFSMSDIPEESLSPQLYMEWDVPAGNNLPLLVFIHGWDGAGGVNGNIDPAAITYLHSQGIGILSLGLRGRNTGTDYANVSATVEEYRDAFGLEAYDELASVKYFLANIAQPGKINQQQIIRYGISGAGLGTPVKVPDLYSLVVSFYAMARYGTYEGDALPSLTGWYTDNLGFQGAIQLATSGAPKGSSGYSAAGPIDQAYMSRDHIAGVKNLLQKVYLYHDSGDSTVKVDQSDAFKDELLAQSKDYEYFRSTDGTWAHGEADIIFGKYSPGNGLDWVSDAKTLTRVAVPNSGTAEVCGFLRWDTQDIEMWCKVYKKNNTATPRAGALANQGKRFRAQVVYNITNETFTVTPRFPGALGDQFFWFDIKKGSKRIQALLSANDVVTLTPKTLNKAPRNLTSYAWNVNLDLSDADGVIVDDAGKISNIVDLTGNQNHAFQQVRATRVALSGSSYIDNGIYFLKGISGTLATNNDGVVYSGEFTIALKIDPDAASVASLNDLIIGRGAGGASYFALGTFSGKVQVNFDTETGSFLSNAGPSNTNVGLQTIVITRDASNQVRVKIKNTSGTYDYGVIGTSTGNFDWRTIGSASAVTKQFNGKIYKAAGVAQKISDADVTDILDNW